MFSLATTLFYILSAYLAFLVGYSSQLPVYFVFFVVVGFVVGYVLDRLPDVRKYWRENKGFVIQLLAIRYVFFLFVASVFLVAGLFLANR